MCATAAIAKPKAHFTITSPDFANGDHIPVEFTCDCDGGKDNEKQLTIRFANIPQGTEALVLIISDPDIPKDVKKRIGRKDFIHMVAYNIPGNVDKFDANSVGEYGKNSAGEKKYMGPCPPSGMHNYNVRAIAAKNMLPSNMDDVNKIVKLAEKQKIAEAKMSGTYSRKS